MERNGKWKRGQCNYPEKPAANTGKKNLDAVFNLKMYAYERHKWCLKRRMCFQSRVFVLNKESFPRGREVTKEIDGFHSLHYYERLIVHRGN